MKQMVHISAKSKTKTELDRDHSATTKMKPRWRRRFSLLHPSPHGKISLLAETHLRCVIWHQWVYRGHGVPSAADLNRCYELKKLNKASKNKTTKQEVIRFFKISPHSSSAYPDMFCKKCTVQSHQTCSHRMS